MSDKIFIGIDGKRIEAKDEQLEYILQSQSEAQEQQRLLEAEQLAKAEARESAMAKLAAIGLTEDEAKIIIGVN